MQISREEFAFKTPQANSSKHSDTSHPNNSIGLSSELAKHLRIYGKKMATQLESHRTANQR